MGRVLDVWYDLSATKAKGSVPYPSVNADAAIPRVKIVFSFGTDVAVT